MRLPAQVLRYGAIGLLVNGAAYAAYLALTWRSVAPLWAMTTTYAGAIMLSFLLNRRVTFAHDGRRAAAFGRYLVTYGGGYLLNLGGLAALIGWFHVPPGWAQGLMVLVVALAMFALQRLWVFSGDTRRAAS